MVRDFPSEGRGTHIVAAVAAVAAALSHPRCKLGPRGSAALASRPEQHAAPEDDGNAPISPRSTRSRAAAHDGRTRT